MRRRAAAIASLVLLAAVACSEPSWQHGPVDVGPRPIVLRPAKPLVAGRARTDLCVGLPDTLRTPVLPLGTVPPDWDSGGILLARGRRLHVRAVLHAAGNAPAPTVSPSVSGPPGQPTAICFGGPLAQPGPAIVAIELSASEPLRLTYVRWRPVRFGSL